MNERLGSGLRICLLVACIGCETPKFDIQGDGGGPDAGDGLGFTLRVNTTAPTESATIESAPPHATIHSQDTATDASLGRTSTDVSSLLPHSEPSTIVETNSRASTATTGAEDGSDTHANDSVPTDAATSGTVDRVSPSSAASTDTPLSSELDSAPTSSGGTGGALPSETTQMSTHGTWCESPIPIVAVKGAGSILNNPLDDLGQVDSVLLERLTICPGEQTEYCDATAEGELIAVMMRECQLPPQICPAVGSPSATGCSQTWMDDIFGGWDEVDSSHYVAQGCCFEGQLEQVYTERCAPELEGARCPRADDCLDEGRCVAGECEAGGPRNCDDGFFCNGQEYCLEEVGCVPGPVPQFDDEPCTADRCDAQTNTVSHEATACGTSCVSSNVTAGVFNVVPSTVRPDLSAYALGAEGSWTEEIQIACGGVVTPSISVPHGTWSCARTDNGEVYVVNEWEVAVSQPVASGCSYEMQYWEVKATGRNAYEGFVFACCIGAQPFDPASPNLEPLPPGP